MNIRLFFQKKGLFILFIIPNSRLITIVLPQHSGMIIVIYCILCDCWRIMYDDCAYGRYITKSFLHVFRINTTINRRWAIGSAWCKRSCRCYNIILYNMYMVIALVRGKIFRTIIIIYLRDVSNA